MPSFLIRTLVWWAQDGNPWLFAFADRRSGRLAVPGDVAELDLRATGSATAPARRAHPSKHDTYGGPWETQLRSLCGFEFISSRAESESGSAPAQGGRSAGRTSRRTSSRPRARVGPQTAGRSTRAQVNAGRSPAAAGRVRLSRHCRVPRARCPAATRCDPQRRHSRAPWVQPTSACRASGATVLDQLTSTKVLALSLVSRS